MGPYLAETNGNVRDALHLYQWNIELSGATYQALHVFEVVLRNAIDVQLRQWNASQRDTNGRLLARSWTDDPAPLLLRLVRHSDLAKARGRAAHAVRQSRRPAAGDVGGLTMKHDDVVAQFTFATWRFLLADADPGRQYLWRSATRHAFPHLRRDYHRMVDDVESIHKLRNRVAHLEPLLMTSVIESRLDAMRRVLREIDPIAEQWLVSQQRITAVARRRPTTS